jgi:BMFP domain-containing protein YqiC
MAEGWGPPAGVTLDGEAIEGEVIEGEILAGTGEGRRMDMDTLVDDLMQFTDQPREEVEAAIRKALNTPLSDDVLAGRPAGDGILLREVPHLPARLADDGYAAVQWFRDPDAVQTLARDAQGALLARISELAAQAHAARAEGMPTPAILAPELNLLGDAHDTLDAIRGVFAAGAKHAKMLAGEVAHELADDPRRGTTTVKVGDAHGTDLKVTRTQPTDVRVDEDDLVDVFVGLLCHRFAAEQRAGSSGDSTDAIRGFAQGARAMVTLYRTHASAHKFKTSTLDALTRELEGEGQDDLAIRLGHAYGRVPNGDPQVKIERAARKGQADG